ncbi:MAG: ABC transporter permease [Desulfobacteraceae bacterium]|nr:ABC transporter permease [Desulfobacteraceae bacterium]
MKISSIVWKELFERKNQLFTSFLAIILGITVIVAIRNIMDYSEKAVARELDALGANILILPKSATVQDYYSADMQDDVFPEEYVTRLTTSDLQGLDNLSPKLSFPVVISGRKMILTGILPKQEFQGKAAWQGVGIFTKPAGCGEVPDASQGSKPDPGALSRKRVIETLALDEILMGSDTAAALNLKDGGSVDIMGTAFKIVGILSTTGTIDDSRIFAHLHTVQKLAGKGPMLNAIEVVGCCNAISAGLVGKINRLLPEAKVLTITQVVDTQIKTNRLMARLSMLFLGIIVIVGGASIANYMYANVFERRQEIAILMGMGATSGFVLRLFLMKALVIGIVGGVAGYFVGTGMAVYLGPKIAAIPVLPMPSLLLWALGISIALNVGASVFPALRATKLDPSIVLQEA